MLKQCNLYNVCSELMISFEIACNPFIDRGITILNMYLYIIQTSIECFGRIVVVSCYRVARFKLKFEVKMTTSLNFRNSVSVERFLYKNAQDVLKSKITTGQANAAAKLAYSWLKAHKLTKENEIIRRLDGIEEILKLQKRKKSPDNESEESSESR